MRTSLGVSSSLFSFLDLMFSPLSCWHCIEKYVFPCLYLGFGGETNVDLNLNYCINLGNYLNLCREFCTLMLGYEELYFLFN